MWSKILFFTPILSFLRLHSHVSMNGMDKNGKRNLRNSIIWQWSRARPPLLRSPRRTFIWGWVVNLFKQWISFFPRLWFRNTRVPYLYVFFSYFTKKRARYKRWVSPLRSLDLRAGRLEFRWNKDFLSLSLLEGYSVCIGTWSSFSPRKKIVHAWVGLCSKKAVRVYPGRSQ